MISAVALLVATPTPLPDQASDLVLVSKFVAALKKGADSEAQSMLTADAFIGDYRQKNRTAFAAFAKYARECSVSKVTVAPNSVKYPRMPIGVEWRCVGLEPSRHASFWFQDDKIARVGWGPLMVIRIPPVKGGQ